MIKRYTFKALCALFFLVSNFSIWGSSSNSDSDDGCGVVIDIDWKKEIKDYTSTINKPFPKFATKEIKKQWCCQVKKCGKILKGIFIDHNGDLRENEQMTKFKDALKKKIEVSFKYFGDFRKEGSFVYPKDFTNVFQSFQVSIKNLEDIEQKADLIKVFWQQMADSYKNYGLNVIDSCVYKKNFLSGIDQFFDFIVTGMHGVNDVFESSTSDDILSVDDDSHDNDKNKLSNIFQNVRTHFLNHPRIYSGLGVMVFASFFYIKTYYPNYFKQKKTN